jgi:hypothetical protein
VIRALEQRGVKSPIGDSLGPVLGMNEAIGQEFAGAN